MKTLAATPTEAVRSLDCGAVTVAQVIAGKVTIGDDDRWRDDRALLALLGPLTVMQSQASEEA